MRLAARLRVAMSSPAPDKPTPTLYVMTGLPGAGKSTYATHLLEDAPGALILSSDSVRWVMQQDRPYERKAERRVWEVIEAYALGCLTYGRSVIVDATNLTISRRAEYLGHAREVGARAELHWLRCSPEESFKRSAKWIALTDIQRLVASSEPPSIEEGWDRLVVVDAKTAHHAVIATHRTGLARSSHVPNAARRDTQANCPLRGDSDESSSSDGESGVMRVETQTSVNTVPKGMAR